MHNGYANSLYHIQSSFDLDEKSESERGNRGCILDRVSKELKIMDKLKGSTLLNDVSEDNSISFGDLDDSSEESYVSSLRDLTFQFNIEEETKKEANSSLFAESPYYDGFVQEEIDSLEVLSSTLKDISSKTRAFAQAGYIMSEATRNLASSCGLNLTNDNCTLTDTQLERKQKALGSEMTQVLQRLGEALNEIAKVQDSMCRIVEDNIGSTQLEEIVSCNLMVAKELKSISAKDTEMAEQALFRYINENNVVRETQNGLTAKQIAQKKSLRWWPAKIISNTKIDLVSSDDLVSSEHDADDTQRTCEALAQAELTRFQLYKYLVDAKQQRTFEISRSTGEFFSEIQTYFCIGSEILKGLTSCISQNQELCENMRARNESDEKQQWQECENSLVKTLTEIAEEADEKSVVCIQANRELWQNSLKIEFDNEDQSLVWKTVSRLQNCSPYHREPSPDVIAEGWLYEQQAEKGRQVDKSPALVLPIWKKRWCILKKDGIFCLEPVNAAPEPGKRLSNSINATATEVKLCDSVTSVVKMVGMQRQDYCFQITSRQQTRLLFQARGPKELKMWTDSIREITMSEHKPIASRCA